MPVSAPRVPLPEVMSAPFALLRKVMPVNEAFCPVMFMAEPGVTVGLPSPVKA